MATPGTATPSGRSSSRTAKSRISSLPTTVAGTSVPSASATVSSSAPATTCAFVTTWPSSSTMNPEPVPAGTSVSSSASSDC